jgi:Mce-associated membrane protein
VTILGGPSRPERPALPKKLILDVPSPTEQVDAEAEGKGRPVAPARLPRWALAGMGLLVAVALLLALFGLQQRSRLQDLRSQTKELRDTSGQLVAALTTYDYQNLDAWRTAVLAHATGSFRNSFNNSFDATKQLLTATHNRATSVVQDVYVGGVQGGRATTVVIVNVTVTGLSGTRQFGSYDKLTVLKVGGRWQVDDIDSLNFDPSNGSGPKAATPGAGATPSSTTTTAPKP